MTSRRRIPLQANREARRERVIVVCLWLIVVAIAIGLLTSCNALSAIRRVAIPPAAKVTAGSTSVEQKGEAQTPAAAKTETKTQEVTLPAGSFVSVNRKSGEIEYRLAKDTPIKAEVKVEQVTAPAAFTPPKPPTIAEEKEAQADFWTVLGYRAGVFVGLAAALYGLTQAWTMVMWGGVAVSGACLFGLFVKSHPVLLAVIGLGVALKFVGPIIWHAKLKHLEKPSPDE